MCQSVSYRRCHPHYSISLAVVGHTLRATTPCRKETLVLRNDHLGFDPSVPLPITRIIVTGRDSLLPAFHMKSLCSSDAPVGLVVADAPGLKIGTFRVLHNERFECGSEVYTLKIQPSSPSPLSSFHDSVYLNNKLSIVYFPFPKDLCRDS